MINTGFNNCAECFGKSFLIDVMLILPNAYGLWFDFNQFRQRILDTSGNGNCATDGNIQLRQFFACQFGSRVHRGASLTGYQIGQL
ncbi:hypothetical protein SDC9_184829 [bioreactor metagenome]|uniref:Uncharacterized protein n=1 Tax=bioreactor metagenome TaxID=1076179 RepID=A0A645HPM0_9ZZZZ